MAVFGLDFRSKVEEEGMCRGVCLGLIFKWSEGGISDKENQRGLVVKDKFESWSRRQRQL